jgi:hypothetical protein
VTIKRALEALTLGRIYWKPKKLDLAKYILPVSGDGAAERRKQSNKPVETTNSNECPMIDLTMQNRSSSVGVSCAELPQAIAI